MTLFIAKVLNDLEVRGAKSSEYTPAHCSQLLQEVAKNPILRGTGVLYITNQKDNAYSVSALLKRPNGDQEHHVYGVTDGGQLVSATLIEYSGKSGTPKITVQDPQNSEVVKEFRFTLGAIEKLHQRRSNTPSVS